MDVVGSVGCKRAEDPVNYTQVTDQSSPYERQQVDERGRERGGNTGGGDYKLLLSSGWGLCVNKYSCDTLSTTDWRRREGGSARKENKY